MGTNVAGVVQAKSPFLKWAGRKTRIFGQLGCLLPVSGRRLVGPFVGSGAVFLNTNYPENVLSDSNADVINLFRVLARGGSEFVEICQALFTPQNNREERFYELRSEFNACSDVVRRSALFVYLNRHCFNGLCRYNRKGEFNTPFGRYRRPYFPRVEMLAFAEKLAEAELRVGDFRAVLREAGGEDVVCGPPVCAAEPDR